MSKRELVFCPHLSAKLDVLYEAFDIQPDLLPAIRSDADLAKHLGISKATVSTLRNGNATKNREPGHLRPQQLEELALLAMLASRKAHSIEDARRQVGQGDRDFLLLSSREEFAALMQVAPRLSLQSVLETRAPTLEVYMVRMPDGFAISPEQHRPAEGEFRIGHGVDFTLHVKAASRQKLIVLAVGPDGWSWLVPGPTHDGRVSRSPERIPANDSWRFNEGSGPHEFVAIQVPSTALIKTRSRAEPVRLDRNRELQLIGTLIDPVFSSRWAWGRFGFFIKPMHWADEPCSLGAPG